MTELLTAHQMRAIELAAIDSGQVTGLELMERAGRGVIDTAFREFPELPKTSHRAVVLCGPGNNGGDGFVVARLLRDWGWLVDVYLYGDPEKLPTDARTNYDRWLAKGPILLDVPKWSVLEQADIIIDALFGTGLTRGLEGQIAQLARILFDQSSGRKLDGKIIAIDMPSGVCADSGLPLGKSSNFKAALTITFHTPKIGHYIGFGPMMCGKVVTVDIGLGVSASNSDHKLLTLKELKPDLKYLAQKSVISHKYNYGHALILSGPAYQTGAARLAARGALRIGAGVVTIGAPDNALAEHAAQLNAIMLKPINDTAEFDAVINDDRITAICIGPALGLSKDRVELVKAVLKSKRATVLDADALTLIAQNKELRSLLHDKCVLTPHAGEFTRLFPDLDEKLKAPIQKGPTYSKVNATSEASKRVGCTVLFKGADTVIAAPDGSISISSAQYDRSAPWLATAGSGDVLAGFITGLLARGMTPENAAKIATWLHIEAALRYGPGLISEDIPEQLPFIFNDLLP